LKITVLCTDPVHPVNRYLDKWISEVKHRHSVDLARYSSELSEGDFLFLVSCSEIVKPEHRENYSHTLVLHASDLPKGRGWSPHIWEIVNGGDSITLSLLEAEDSVDTGRLWLKCQIPITKTALWYDVNNQLFDAEIKLMNKAVERYRNIQPCAQNPNSEPTYHRKRTPRDSQLDPCQSIADQFNLIRMCDPDRYPAWFELHGQKYKLTLEKLDNA
jgi:methionyl-tRNA formyltransferase